jgi:hypothetical protein
MKFAEIFDKLADANWEMIKFGVRTVSLGRVWSDEPMTETTLLEEEEDEDGTALLGHLVADYYRQTEGRTPL